MKLFLSLSLLLTLSNMAVANTVENSFDSDSKLPNLLKERILEKIKLEIPCLKNDSLKEVKTTEVVDVVDQGVVDYVYTTTLKFQYYPDRYHPAWGELIVKSEHWAGYCKDYCNMQVLEMNSQYFTCDGLQDAR